MAWRYAAIGIPPCLFVQPRRKYFGIFHFRQEKKRLKTTSKISKQTANTKRYKLNNYAVKLVQSHRQGPRQMFVKFDGRNGSEIFQ